MCPTFPTTRRSVVLSLSSGDAGERARATDTLVAIYWKPLYKYGRLAWGRSPEDCEDLTQSFFTRMIETEALRAYDPAKASFRTFLRTLFDRHNSNEWRASTRTKRGGDRVRVDFAGVETELANTDTRATSPDEIFQREWVRSVFALAVERLREDCIESGRLRYFEVFEAYDLADDRTVSYRELAARFSIPETSVTNNLAAARRMFRQAILDALREATASEQEFRAEARALLGTDG